MTRTEILDEIKIIIIGLVSFTRAYIIPVLVFKYVTIVTLIESIKDNSKAKSNWSSFTSFVSTHVLQA